MWETVACCQISSLIIRCDCRISSLVSQQHCGCLLVRTEKSWQGTEPGIAVSSTSPSSPPYLQSFSISLPAFVRPSKPWDTCRVGSALTLHHCTEWFWVGWQSGWFSIHRATLLCTTMNQVSLLCTTLPLCHPAMHVHYAPSHSTISLSLSLHNPILLLDSYELIALTSTPQVLYLHSTISCISYYPAKP